MCDLKNPYLTTTTTSSPTPSLNSQTNSRPSVPQTLLSLPTPNFLNGYNIQGSPTLSKGSSRSSLDPILGKYILIRINLIDHMYQKT